LLTESFTNGVAHKMEGVVACKTLKFECSIMENAKVRKHKSQGNFNTDVMAF
jgi:hypothetical protein